MLLWACFFFSLDYDISYNLIFIQILCMLSSKYSTLFFLTERVFNWIISFDHTMAHHGQKVEYQIYSSGWFCWKIYFFPEFFFLTIVNASKWHTGITCSISQKNVTHVWKIHEKTLKIGVFPSFEGVNEKIYFFPEMK